MEACILHMLEPHMQIAPIIYVELGVLNPTICSQRIVFLLLLPPPPASYVYHHHALCELQRRQVLLLQQIRPGNKFLVEKKKHAGGLAGESIVPLHFSIFPCPLLL